MVVFGPEWIQEFESHSLLCGPGHPFRATAFRGARAASGRAPGENLLHALFGVNRLLPFPGWLLGFSTLEQIPYETTSQKRMNGSFRNRVRRSSGSD